MKQLSYRFLIDIIIKMVTYRNPDLFVQDPAIHDLCTSHKLHSFLEVYIVKLKLRRV